MARAARPIPIPGPARACRWPPSCRPEVTPASQRSFYFSDTPPDAALPVITAPPGGPSITQRVGAVVVLVAGSAAFVGLVIVPLFTLARS